MLQPVRTLTDFTSAIAGRWYNPATKNEYLFTPDVADPGKGEVAVTQYGAAAPILLHIGLAMKDELLIVMVEGAEYEVSLPSSPVQSLNIVLAPGNIVRLLKED